MRWLFDYLAKFWKFLFSLPRLFSCVFTCVLFIHRQTLKQYNTNIFKLWLICSNNFFLFFKKQEIISIASVYFSYFKTIPSLVGLNICLSHPDSAHPQWYWPFPCHHPPPPSLIFPWILQELQQSGLWGTLLPGQPQRPKEVTITWQFWRNLTHKI